MSPTLFKQLSVQLVLSKYRRLFLSVAQQRVKSMCSGSQRRKVSEEFYDDIVCSSKKRGF